MKKVKKWTAYFGRRCAKVLVLLIVMLYCMPLIVTFTNSFMSASEVRSHYSADIDEFIKMDIIPDKVTLSQYYELLIKNPMYLKMFWNSVKIVIPIMIMQIAVSVIGAYAFTVLKFRGKELLYMIYIIVMLLPLQVTLLPNYIVADWLNLAESDLAIILPGVFSPFSVFLLRQYLKSMPDCYIEAAQMDGAGHGMILWSIILPMLKPGLAAAAMLIILDYWNLVDQAVVFIHETKNQPLSVFLAQISNDEMGLIFSGSVFYAIPVAVLLLYGQKKLKNGITISGLKN